MQPVSLLDDPVFVIDRPGGERTSWSLPELLARLLVGDDPVRSYPGLAAEQVSHWYRFLVRCAAKALRMRGSAPSELIGRDPDDLASDLGDAMLDAAGSPEAWVLWHDQVSNPAFLQAPIAEGGDPEESGYKPRPIASLTSLIGSKEFERKSEAIRYMTALEVVYALIEFHGGVIFGGRGNYETQLTPSRSGKGSGVPFMGIRFPRRSGETFRHDVGVLLASWDEITMKHGLRGARWALWTLPWDGDNPLPASELDPAFIPLARLVRLVPPDEGGRFSGLLFKASRASRVADHTDGGMLGDPFTPSVPHPRHEGQFKVRGVMESGFSYPEAAELLGLGERGGTPSPSVQAFFDRAGSESRADVEVRFEGVAFEQGKTLGFFRRALPLPVQASASWLFAELDPLRNTHHEMLRMVRQAKKCLRAASRIVLHGEPRPQSGDENAADQASALLDRLLEASDNYFRFLFAAAPREAEADESWRLEWGDCLAGWAAEVFDGILPRLPAPGAQRLSREMNARDFLSWRLRELRADETNSTDGSS